MNGLIEPNIHPILVHFAYALTATAAGSYLMSSLKPAARWKQTLVPAADWMLTFAAIAVAATIAAGFQAYYSVAHDGPSHVAMTTHRNWAVPSGLAVLGLAAWRWRSRQTGPSPAFAGLITAAAIAMTVTAWWGGMIVYKYGLGVASLPAVTGDGHDHDHGAPPEGPAVMEGVDASSMDVEGLGIEPAIPGSAESVVDAFAAALRSGDADAVAGLLAPDAVIAEGGGAERSYTEYAGHHLAADMAFTAAVKASLLKRDVLDGGGQVTVISESMLHGTYQEKTIHSRMLETMVLVRDGEDWKIVHIHWSSAPIKGEHDH